jgi:hypothetical protein
MFFNQGFFYEKEKLLHNFSKVLVEFQMFLSMCSTFQYRGLIFQIVLDFFGMFRDASVNSLELLRI